MTRRLGVNRGLVYGLIRTSDGYSKNVSRVTLYLRFWALWDIHRALDFVRHPCISHRGEGPSTGDRLMGRKITPLTVA